MGLFNIFKKKEEVKVTVKYEWFDRMIYPDHQEHEEEFHKYFKMDLYKNDNYTLTKKELREYHDGEKVYKYYPFTLDYMIEGHDVLSHMKEEEWMKIGTVTEEEKEVILNNNSRLSLYDGTYKDVDDDVEIVEGDPFFGFYVKRKKKRVTHDPKK